MFQQHGILLTGALLVGLAATAQEPRATLSGRAVDALSGQPLPDATVLLLPSDPPLGTTTDSLGRFTIADAPVGLFTVKVQLLGYDPLLVPETWLRAGKESVLRVALTPATFALETFTVTAMAREEPEALGVRTFTVEQGLRYPAVFQDPARLVSTTPGVATTNDQANHLSIRGNSPNANAWLLEGAEIVSPNHTGNAGTPSDLPTLSGGGVSILSAQMLGPSRLRTGVSPVMYGNALGGLMDMELRRGNAREREWTLQAGLLGIDISTEGPIGKDQRAFHLVNYRYSTIGLLSAMGVDLGDEAIGFQDLAFHVGTRLGELGELRVFGMGGISSNVFEAERDTAAWAFDKDSRDITYTSHMGALGATLMAPLGERSTLHATVVASASDQQREETPLRSDLEPWYTSHADLYERKLTAVLRAEGAWGTRWRYTAGASAMERTTVNTMRQEVVAMLVRPFGQLHWQATEHLRLMAGMAYALDDRSGSALWEPRASAHWRMAQGRALGLAYGRRAQLPHTQAIIQFAGADVQGLMVSEDITLGYDHAVNERLTFRLEGYLQRIDDVPVSMPMFNTPFHVNLLNTWDDPAFLPLVQVGSGSNRGVEVSVTHNFTSGYFYQANVSGFESRYTTYDGTEFPTRWDAGWIANAMGGKEFEKKKEDRVRTWGVSARLYAMGGQRYTPINVVQLNGFPVVLLSDAPFSAQQSDFFRADLRVYLKKDRKGRTGQWALDLQNATNAQNEAFRYFDQRKGEVVIKYQLGLIPNLSYRVEF